MKKSLRLLAATVLTASVVAPISANAAGTETQAGVTVANVGVAGTGGNMSAATMLCGGISQKNVVYGGSGEVVTTGALFVKSGFEVMCSNNVLLKAIELSGNTAAVASGSLKGNQSFKGSTNGGAVAAHLKCTGLNDMCITTLDVDPALTQACKDAGLTAGC